MSDEHRAPDVANWNRLRILHLMDLESKSFDLKVPYKEKDAAKALGARWDHRKKTWFAPKSERELLVKWGGFTKPNARIVFSEYWTKRAAAKSCDANYMLATHPDHWPHLF
jgi:hypothetical protein